MNSNLVIKAPGRSLPIEAIFDFFFDCKQFISVQTALSLNNH